ncbi:cytochrome-c peroxidase [Ideonella sp.]|uniref:cytochrome-c peroxidase n=1 Tax=Ideonella sp. TaxID=1929293 RepID=UPI0035B40543
MKLRLRTLALAMAAAGAAGAMGVAAVASTTSAEPIQPIVRTPPADRQMVELGKKLFFDPRLSRSGFISCNSCHNLSMGGTDNVRSSIGHHWAQGPINAPTVLNASFNVAQFWDGRAADLKAQAGGPIANPGEMGFSHEMAVDVLRSIPQYVDEFTRVYKKAPLDIEQVTQAIAEFEKTLVTPNSRFDQWLQGDTKALSAQELAGYQLFKGSGCVACHNGAAVGGGSFQKMGLVSPFKSSSSSLGRYEVTKQEADKYYFKVPTLRNIELTYPYFHDGSAATLHDAVDVMGQVQLGRRFTADENDKIVAFLKTLTGDQPAIVLPVLPPSGDKTPRPQPFN